MNKEIIKILLILTIIVCYFADLTLLLFCPPLELLIANGIIWLIIIVIIIGFAFVEWLKCRKGMLIENREKVVKGEKIYDVGDVVLYNRKKCKITHANWRINEYRIIEIEKPNNYYFVVGEELKEVSE